MKIALLVIFVLLFAGCSYGNIAKKNNELMLTLNTGQTKQEVLQVMGNPSSNERYADNGKDIEVWFYRTSSFASGGWDSDDYFTPLVFEDSKLIGWGKDFYRGRIESKSMSQM